MSTPPAPPPPAMSAEQMIVKLEGIESVLAPLAAGFTPGTRGALADARSVLAALRAPTPADLEARLHRLRVAVMVAVSQGPELGHPNATWAETRKALADALNADLATPPALGTPLAAEAAAEPQGQQGPLLKSPYGHVWGKPYDDGYATCRCGAREDTRSRERCPAAEAATEDDHAL